MQGFDLSTIQDVYVGGVGFSYIYHGSDLIWQKPYEQQYFTMEALENNGTFVFYKYGSPGDTYYSKNGNTWTLLSHADTISVNTGDKVRLKRDTSTGTYSQNNRISLDSFVDFNVYGNIESLVYGDNFTNKTDLNGKNYIFDGLLGGNNKLKNASNLILPATSLTNHCYYDMFINCISLIAAPELPATTLAQNCYTYMFSGCTSLSTAPNVLPATTLANSCYYGMFYNCGSLTTAPELPATTLVNNCYNEMFTDCSSLNYIKCLATDISATSCTYNWVQGVAATGTFVKYSNTTWNTGDNGIPTDWTVQSIEPDYSTQYFTVEYLTSNSSRYFEKYGSSIPDIYISTDNGATWNTYAAGVRNVNVGDKILFKCDRSNSTFNYNDYIKFASNAQYKVYGNVLSLIYGDNFIGQNITGKTCALMRLFYQNSNLIDASNLVLPDTTAESCYSNTFGQCSNLEHAPELPATVLSNYCYDQLFSGCSKIDEIKCYATNISATGCLYNWTSNVAASGTFYKDTNTTYPSGSHGIPSNWSIQNL